ncbi:hypothetical protein RhiirA1_457102 [Rhizophagus irregularis]|uniref:Uncharacterized protein n=1 Tax=Rhizophagus irregularis TaxID=588596 RepID=A0A2N0RZ09_9GLOM|nr:hypothetical protein RhiirA1_457102 [Rhizophagus irregularis]
MVAYNIKNFLEILPSMDILNKRSPEIYKSGRCVRCGHAIETWTHIWMNQVTIDQVINQALEIVKNELLKGIVNDNLYLEIQIKDLKAWSNLLFQLLRI